MIINLKFYKCEAGGDDFLGKIHQIGTLKALINKILQLRLFEHYIFCKDDCKMKGVGGGWI